MVGCLSDEHAAIASDTVLLCWTGVQIQSSLRSQVHINIWKCVLMSAGL